MTKEKRSMKIWSDPVFSKIIAATLLVLGYGVVKYVFEGPKVDNDKKEIIKDTSDQANTLENPEKVTTINEPQDPKSPAPKKPAPITQRNKIQETKKAEPKSLPQPLPIPLPKSKKTRSTLFNDKFKGNVAILDLENKNESSVTLNDFLKQEQYKPTLSFFRSNFLARHQKNIWTQGLDLLEELPIPDNLKCVCLLKEHIQFTVTKQHGHDFTVAKGEVQLKILNISNGEATVLKIPAGGSGADFRRAKESFQENFIIEFLKNKHLQNFESCKN